MSLLNRMHQTCQNVSLPNVYGFIFEQSVLFSKTITSIYLTNTDDEMAKLKPRTPQKFYKRMDDCKKRKRFNVAMTWTGFK